MRPGLIVLRPEPGNAATCARIEAAGGRAIALPLFRVRPLGWTPPDPRGFDSLLLTSANAPRHAGPGLATYADLPVVAVGAATAREAVARGLRVIATGSGNAEHAVALLADHDLYAPLHLTGRDHRPAVSKAVAVYASEALPVAPAALAVFSGNSALLHSARTARRLGELVDGAGIERDGIAIAAISADVARAAGFGWRAVGVAAAVGDIPLIAAALSIDRNRA